MSGGWMQTLKFGSRHQYSRLFERLSIGRLVHHFRRALLYFDVFGPTSCAMIGLLLFISWLQQAAHCGAEKGTI
jgi:hypothetical protein